MSIVQRPAPQQPTQAPNAQYGYYYGPVNGQPAQAPQTQYTYTRRRQSVKVHLWLLLLTGGIGNIVYSMWAKSDTAARWQA